MVLAPPPPGVDGTASMSSDQLLASVSSPTFLSNALNTSVVITSTPSVQTLTIVRCQPGLLLQGDGSCKSKTPRPEELSPPLGSGGGDGATSSTFLIALTLIIGLLILCGAYKYHAYHQQLNNLQNAVASGRAMVAPFDGALVIKKSKELPTDKELSKQPVDAGARYITLSLKTTTTEVPWRHAQTDLYRPQKSQWEQGVRQRRATAWAKVDWNAIPRMDWRKEIQVHPLCADTSR